MKDVCDLKWEIVAEVADRVREFMVKTYGEQHGLCLYATRHLVRLLSIRGVQAIGVEGDVTFEDPGVSVRGYHVWAEVDGLIVDVSADQFNTSSTTFQPVLIGTYVENPFFRKRRVIQFLGYDFDVLHYEDGEVFPLKLPIETAGKT